MSKHRCVYLSVRWSPLPTLPWHGGRRRSYRWSGSRGTTYWHYHYIFWTSGTTIIYWLDPTYVSPSPLKDAQTWGALQSILVSLLRRQTFLKLVPQELPPRFKALQQYENEGSRALEIVEERRQQMQAKSLAEKIVAADERGEPESSICLLRCFSGTFNDETNVERCHQC